MGEGGAGGAIEKIEREECISGKGKKWVLGDGEGEKLRKP